MYIHVLTGLKIVTGMHPLMSCICHAGETNIIVTDEQTPWKVNTPCLNWHNLRMDAQNYTDLWIIFILASFFSASPIPGCCLLKCWDIRDVSTPHSTHCRVILFFFFFPLKKWKISVYIIFRKEIYMHLLCYQNQKKEAWALCNEA